ncbi:LysR family transcriptional regulator [Pseudomonas sp. NPDC087346]|uniref:LysR family transcriptional regulator n=1 Tax=Pseudomonas sp. NPDC087346 TaxID=3364438 RepID=UPI00382D0F7B
MEYRYFLAVAETGSLAEASKRLHIATSAISRQIVILEEHIGTKLFDRQARGMYLTAAGHTLAEHAKRARLDDETVWVSIRDNDFSRARVIRLASTEGLSRYFLPKVMANFLKPTSEINFVITVASPSDCIKMVNDGDADIGLIFSTAPIQNIKIEYSCRSPICALMRIGHPLASSKQLSLADLNAFPVAVTQQGTTQRQLFDLVCQMENLKFSEVLVCNYSGAIHEFVRQTDAITLGSEISHGGMHQDGLTSVNLTNFQLSQRDILVLTMPKRTLPPAVHDFLETLKSHLQLHGILRPDQSKKHGGENS